MRKEQTSHKNEHNTLMCFPLEPVFIRDGEGVPNFIDEPTSGLDPLVRSQLLNILKDYMGKGGKGVFFSTHITSDLEKIADMLIMIDGGEIVFQEEKDQLLDSYRIIKGSTEKLNTDTRKYFLNIEESAFGFTGITKQGSDVMEHMQDALTERPTIEDIMLANVERRKKDVN